MDWPGWEKAVLTGGGWPNTAANRKFLDQWHQHELSVAFYNPLNTTQAEPGSIPINSVGVQSYPNEQEGLAATLKTLRNGYYAGILAALASGDPFTYKHADLVALDLNTWGSHSFASYYLTEAKYATPPVGSTTSSPAGALSKQAPWQHGWHAVSHALGKDMPRSLDAAKRARRAALRSLGAKGKVR